LTAIRSRDAAALFRSGASFVDLLQLMDFRPFPESAHLWVHRNAHDWVPSQNFELERVMIGGECRDHQDDKNGSDEGWNKPGSHATLPSLIPS
jgi:hypothetical protein